MPYVGRTLLDATVRPAEISLDSFLHPSVPLSLPASVPPPCPASFLLPFLPAVSPLYPLVKHGLAAISSTIHRLQYLLKKSSGEINYHQVLIKSCYWVYNYSTHTTRCHITAPCYFLYTSATIVTLPTKGKV